MAVTMLDAAFMRRVENLREALRAWYVAGQRRKDMDLQQSSAELSQEELEMHSLGLLIRMSLRQGPDTASMLDSYSAALASMNSGEETGLPASKRSLEVRNAN